VDRGRKRRERNEVISFWLTLVGRHKRLKSGEEVSELMRTT
jgi:hypothetical protein